MWKLEETINWETGEERDEVLEALTEPELWEMLSDRYQEALRLNLSRATWELFQPGHSSSFAVFLLVPGNEIKDYQQEGI